MEGNLLYIVNRMDCPHGGAIINRRNYDLLKDIYHERLFLYEFDYDFRQSMCSKVMNMFHGRLYGITSAHLEAVCQLIECHEINCVFIGYSLFSCFISMIKKKYPRVKVITFFHNVECDYALGEYEAKGGLKLRVVSLLARIYESITVKRSDYLITLNQRDGERVRQIYKREVDLTLPTTFKDKWELEKVCAEREFTKPLKLLFVGFNFYANVHGIDWFVKNVIPHVSGIVLYVVGKDMERERERWQSEKVVVVGTVDCLEVWYQKADIVVLPIFLGSGMKTKTAEALMYGKPVLGTSEAFEGYDIDIAKVGYLCDDAQVFIDKLNAVANDEKWIQERALGARQIFETQYTYETSLSKLQLFFDTKVNN